MSQQNAAEARPPAAVDERGAPFLVARDIVVEYQQANILERACLTVTEGETHVLIGPNGAGKTTLANVLTGHVRPVSGQVELRGRPLTGSSWQRARKGIGRKFQVPRVFTRLNAQENLTIADTRQRKDTGGGSGDDIGVDEILQTSAEALSHGWRQRLEMKMVLDQRPLIGVLDEPTAGMPKPERVELARIIRAHRGRMTYLIVEHDMDFVKAVADMVSFMHDGRVVASGTFEEIRANPTVREIYLGEAVTAAPVAPGGG